MTTPTPDPRHAEEIPSFLNRALTPPPPTSESLRAVLALTPIQALRVHHLCCERSAKFPRVDDSNSLEIVEEGAAAKALLLAALRSGNGVAELVSMVVRDRGADDAVTKLTGKTVTRIPERGRNAPPAKPTAHAVPRARGSKSPAYDPADTIASFVPNPKKKGGAPHARYEKYRVGATVAECIQAGLIPADIAWDLSHNFITTTKAVRS